MEICFEAKLSREGSMFYYTKRNDTKIYFSDAALCSEAVACHLKTDKPPQKIFVLIGGRKFGNAKPYKVKLSKTQPFWSPFLLLARTVLYYHKKTRKYCSLTPYLASTIQELITLTTKPKTIWVEIREVKINHHETKATIK